MTDTPTRAARRAGSASSAAALCAVQPANNERVLLWKWLENCSKIKMLLSKKPNSICDHLYQKLNPYMMFARVCATCVHLLGNIPVLHTFR